MMFFFLILGQVSLEPHTYYTILTKTFEKVLI